MSDTMDVWNGTGPDSRIIGRFVAREVVDKFAFQRTAPPDGRKTWPTCPHCGKEFVYENRLSRHIAKVHPEPKP